MLNTIDANHGQLLRREIDAALLDRDRTIKEAHELREKLGMLILVKLLMVVVFKDNARAWRGGGA